MIQDIKQESDIQSFFHCRECLEELPDGESPRSYASLEVGWTIKGLQVWCKRHELNVINLDFRGQKVSPL
jgi:hypothetical protein